jgi:hypothetical protein
LLAPDGATHVRYLPAALAAELVNSGVAAIVSANGRVKQIRLTECAATHATVIGPAEGTCRGVKFAIREKLDCGSLVWRHHPRATDYF